MSSALIPEPLKSFTRLRPSVYLYDPPQTSTSTNSLSKTTIPDPDLILLSSWLGAHPRHIAKYTSSYQRLYPHSRILLITTHLVEATLPASTKSNIQRRDAVLEVLLALPPDARILLHTFSNVGSMTAVAIAKDLYLRRRGTPLHLEAQVIDSAPGKGGYRQTITALSLSLPKGNMLVYYLGLALVYVFITGLWVLDKMLGWGNPVMVMQRELNDVRIWGEGGKRLYIASEADQLVKLGDVLEHAAAAEDLGWRVRREVFVGSGHVGHMVVDEGRYWRAVKEVWEGK